MKKIIKLSMLVAIFMALLTVVSFAADKNATVTYGELTSSGSMTITVEFPDDRDMANSSYDDLFDDINSDNWTVASDRQSMTLTATGVNTKSFIRYYYGGSEDEGVTVKVATPFQMNVGGNLTYESSTITNSSDTSVVSFSGKTITALKAGTSKLTLSDTTDEGKNYTYEHQVTVVGESDSDNSEATADFSKATYSYVIDDSLLIINNVKKPANSLYFVIDNNSNTEYSDSARLLDFDTNNNFYVINLDNSYGDAIMQSKDAYIHIFERVLDSSNNPKYVKVTEKKLEKPDFGGLNKFSGASMATYNRTQLLLDGILVNLNGNNYGLSTRTVHFKIGQITDSNILTAIKNNDSDGFSNLLTYAKNSTNPIIDMTETANDSRGYIINEELVAGSKFSDGAYYYLYLVVDDENGKYLPIESITIAQADVFPELDGYPWYLFFYGSDDFNFDGVADGKSSDIPTSSSDDSSKEEEKLPTKLAKTGESTIFLVVIGTLVISLIVVRKKIHKI